MQLKWSVTHRRIEPEETISSIEALKSSMNLETVSGVFIRNAIREGRA